MLFYCELRPWHELNTAVVKLGGMGPTVVCLKVPMNETSFYISKQINSKVLSTESFKEIE